MVKIIELTHGMFTLVDDVDYDEQSGYRWAAMLTHGKWYAMRQEKLKYARRYATIYLHREIAMTPDGMDTDHDNGDTLDNRQCNLMVVTHQQNQRNRRRGYGVTGHRNVYIHPHHEHRYVVNNPWLKPRGLSMAPASEASISLTSPDSGPASRVTVPGPWGRFSQLTRAVKPAPRRFHQGDVACKQALLLTVREQAASLHFKPACGTDLPTVYRVAVEFRFPTMAVCRPVPFLPPLKQGASWNDPVSLQPQSGKIHIGVYDTLEDAIAAAKSARLLHYGRE